MINFNKYNDNELLELLRKAKPDCDTAFQVLYNRHSEKLNSYCMFKALNDKDAEEIFQDTWMKFYNSVREGKSVDSVGAFLYKIARNLSIDKYRSSKHDMVRNLGKLDLERLADPLNIHYDCEKDELVSLVYVALNSLSEVNKEAFVLQWFGGLTYKEISEVSGETPECIKMRSHRALQDVIKILKPYIIELSQ